MTFKIVPEGIKFALFCMSGLPRVQKSADFISKGTIFKRIEKKEEIFDMYIMNRHDYQY